MLTIIDGPTKKRFCPEKIRRSDSRNEMPVTLVTSMVEVVLLFVIGGSHQGG